MEGYLLPNLLSFFVAAHLVFRNANCILYYNVLNYVKRWTQFTQLIVKEGCNLERACLICQAL